MFRTSKTEINKKHGFTLVEMMVAVSIFVIVAFIVVSTLLTMSYAYKRAQKMRLLMDNFNFSLQSMSLNIREGINYNNDHCSAAEDCIEFLPIDSWLNNESQTVCYSKNSTSVKKCFGACPCQEDELDIISPEIQVDSLKFNIVGEGGTLKKVKIIISGMAGTAPRERTDFFIQNTISQRNNDQ
ncbi:MAG: type II secretion system protein [Candidatus Paceibacterota bacterium]|jgi:prepilin-type N-terminal cleavage/methylation domain-containing protein